VYQSALCYAAAVAIVFAGVPVAATPRLAARLAAHPGRLVVAADAGAATARAFGLVPDVVVGDLDSIDAATLADVRARGVPIEQYPRDKEATDGELAVLRALGSGEGPLLLVGFLGGPRLDQAASNLLLLTRLPPGTVLLDELNECRLLRSGETHAWQAEGGEVVSLIPVGVDARGVTTRGLRWSLQAATLVAGGSRGVSNEPSASWVEVALDTGLLLVARHFPA